MDQKKGPDTGPDEIFHHHSLIIQASCGAVLVVQLPTLCYRQLQAVRGVGRGWVRRRVVVVLIRDDHTRVRLRGWGRYKDGHWSGAPEDTCRDSRDLESLNPADCRRLRNGE